MGETKMFYAYAAGVAAALLLLLASWRWRNVARFCFVLLFVWAAQDNLRAVIAAPRGFLDYAPLADSDLYRQFILGYFARHVTPIVGTIAVAQLAIAALISWRGTAVRVGLAGAIVFLVATAPLGPGSAFPATLITAVAAAMLLRKPFTYTLWTAVRRAVTPRTHGTHAPLRSARHT